MGAAFERPRPGSANSMSETTEPFPSGASGPVPRSSPADPAPADRGPSDVLLPLVYDELRALASSRLSREARGGAGLTLQPTALVHEAFLRVAGGGDGDRPQWQNRGHFFGAASLAMRRILIERARHVRRAKHGGGRARVDLDDAPEPPAGPAAGDEAAAAADLLALDRALTRLEALDARKAKVVSLRYFGGLTVEATAAAMDLSPATVKSEWAFARAWLRREIGGEAEAASE